MHHNVKDEIVFQGHTQITSPERRRGGARDKAYNICHQFISISY